MNTQARSAFINSLWNNRKLEKAIHVSVKARLDRKQNIFDEKMSKHPEALNEQKHYQENWKEYRKRQQIIRNKMLRKVACRWNAKLKIA
ncbi:hypothetical protein GF336_00705 [Candidatus Woesearchaeota archaeon]|nr:hypothetical protein [Candidatus Woesearchaeota archaeon]